MWQQIKHDSQISFLTLICEQSGSSLEETCFMPVYGQFINNNKFEYTINKNCLIFFEDYSLICVTLNLKGYIGHS